MPREIVIWLELAEVRITRVPVTGLYKIIRKTINLVCYPFTIHVLVAPVRNRYFNPIRPGLFSRSPGPGGGKGGSEAQMPKIKFNIDETLHESFEK